MNQSEPGVAELDRLMGLAKEAFSAGGGRTVMENAIARNALRAALEGVLRDRDESMGLYHRCQDRANELSAKVAALEAENKRLEVALFATTETVDQIAMAIGSRRDDVVQVVQVARNTALDRVDALEARLREARSCAEHARDLVTGLMSPDSSRMVFPWEVTPEEGHPIPIRRLSVPGHYCHCGAKMGESLICPGCGWADPQTTREPKAKEGHR